MIELVFTVCLLSAPDRCEERRLLFAETMTPMQCLMGAQTELAKWNAANPKWMIKRWKCGDAKTASTDA